MNLPHISESVETMTAAIRQILAGNPCTIYLYGSVTMNDFRPGWSDIDLLCLTEHPFDDATAEQLLTLRQDLLLREPNHPYYRSFEGAIVPADDYLTRPSSRAVYWGTSGQRVTRCYVLDPFSQKELLNTGILVCGEDLRPRMKMPAYEDLYAGMVSHYETIRQYAVTVPRRITSYGWLLDIARCIYTLRTGEILSKTAAAEWALENNLCPVPETLRKALYVRKNSLESRENPDILDFTAVLGGDIQRFADVLETELRLHPKMP